MKNIIKNPYLYLLLILVLALFLRLYQIDRPLADHHSWRQADTAAVARNFIKEEFNLFEPKIDNFSPTSAAINGQFKENSQRLFLTEVPIYNSIVAWFYYLFGVKESLARLVSIFFSLASIVFLFLIVKKLIDMQTALLAALLLAVLPYSIFFSTVILPEPTMVALSLVGLYFLLRFKEEERISLLLLSAVFISLAVLVKSFAIFLGLPIFYLFFQKYRWNVFKNYKFILFGTIVILPIVFWRLWILQFPEGIPDTNWLFNSTQIRFRPAFVYWLIGERLDKLILTAPIFAFFVLGLLLRSKKEGLFFYFWLLSILIYFVIFATGNVTHDYYQLIFLPVGVTFAAKGANFLSRLPKDKFFNQLGVLVVILAIPLASILGWFQVKNFYDIKGGVDLAGKAVNEIADSNALVISGDGADVSLLYNTNRYGWVTGFGAHYANDPETIEILKAKGASFYVTTKIDQLNQSGLGSYLRDKYQVAEETNQYVIFNLQ